MIETLYFDALKTLLKAMEPVNLAVENLSQDDAMLMSASTIAEFLFNKLSNLNNDISTKLLENLKCRVEEQLKNMSLTSCAYQRSICRPAKYHAKFRKKSAVSSIWRFQCRRYRQTVVK
ncbi:hypothetical protein ACJMK2_043844 [Sinanodonta woodiana]|uniref:Uncharacterized protein n=1 Tax=Sinanodonta woodiana TaxID=1069815 RepID=A0ABD3VY55_SINWO